MNTTFPLCSLQVAGRWNVPNWAVVMSKAGPQKTSPQYVRERDRGGKVLLCRDHGGPWQGNGEADTPIGVGEAMERAKCSYAADIAADFTVIHVDPSIDPFQSPPRPQDILVRLFDLYRFCWDTARKAGRPIIFEVGTEEQVPLAGRLHDTKLILDEMSAFAAPKNAAAHVCGRTDRHQGRRNLQRRCIWQPIPD